MQGTGSHRQGHVRPSTGRPQDAAAAPVASFAWRQRPCVSPVLLEDRAHGTDGHEPPLEMASKLGCEQRMTLCEMRRRRPRPNARDGTSGRVAGERGSVVGNNRHTGRLQDASLPGGDPHEARYG
jgi:hypothetical protein